MNHSGVFILLHTIYIYTFNPVNLSRINTVSIWRQMIKSFHLIMLAGTETNTQMTAIILTLLMPSTVWIRNTIDSEYLINQHNPQMIQMMTRCDSDDITSHEPASCLISIYFIHCSLKCSQSIILLLNDYFIHCSLCAEYGVLQLTVPQHCSKQFSIQISQSIFIFATDSVS